MARKTAYDYLSEEVSLQTISQKLYRKRYHLTTDTEERKIKEHIRKKLKEMRDKEIKCK